MNGFSSEDTLYSASFIPGPK